MAAPIWHTLDAENLSKRYLAGESLDSIADDIGVNRQTLTRALERYGIEIRTAQWGWNQRRRGQKAGATELHRKAQWKQRTLIKEGAGERLLGSWLVEMGFPYTPQLAVGPYNLDLAVGNIAVEVHMASRQPSSSPGTRKRIEYLLNHDWSVIYIWISHSHFLTEAAAYEVVALDYRLSRLPSGGREYRVVRGDGEFFSTIQYEPHQVAVVPMPVRSPNSPR